MYQVRTPLLQTCSSAARTPASVATSDEPTDANTRAPPELRVTVTTAVDVGLLDEDVEADRGFDVVPGTVRVDAPALELGGDDGVAVDAGDADDDAEPDEPGEGLEGAEPDAEADDPDEGAAVVDAEAEAGELVPGDVALPLSLGGGTLPEGGPGMTN
ncbi:hypothetical protein BKA93DRAFT_241701 [Sparassis latifolia]